MHIHYFQQLFLFICLFFILPSAGKDIFVEFAQALEAVKEEELVIYQNLPVFTERIKQIAKVTQDDEDENEDDDEDED